MEEKLRVYLGVLGKQKAIYENALGTYDNTKKLDKEVAFRKALQAEDTTRAAGGCVGHGSGHRG